MNRRLTLAAPIALLLLLTACTAAAPPEPTPEPEQQKFAARQLAGIGLTVEDFGGQWVLNEDPAAVEGGPSEGSGPGGEAVEQPDICAWATNWMPDTTQFYSHSWRTYTTGDGATFAQDWVAAIEPDTDPAQLLADLRAAVEACGITPDPAQPDGTVTLVPDIIDQLGDGSFSYRADFAHPDFAIYGSGEVHTILCGNLWLHLSYIGYDPFIERDALLATMLERAAPLGGCTA